MNEKITTDRIIELMMAQTGRDRTAVQTFVGRGVDRAGERMSN